MNGIVYTIATTEQSKRKEKKPLSKNRCRARLVVVGARSRGATQRGSRPSRSLRVLVEVLICTNVLLESHCLLAPPHTPQPERLLSPPLLSFQRRARSLERSSRPCSINIKYSSQLMEVNSYAKTRACRSKDPNCTLLICALRNTRLRRMESRGSCK